MSKILFYLIVKPVSLLPFWVLYLLSDAVALFLYSTGAYRKKNVIVHLTASFPNKTISEIRSITKTFYFHFCDVFVETIKLFSISEKEIMKRCKLINDEVLDSYYDAGQDIIVITGHYNNWEYMAALGPQVKHRFIGIYKKLKNQFFDQAIYRARTRFGVSLLSRDTARKTIRTSERQPSITMFMADQTFIGSKRDYWLTFLNQETAVPFGPELYAKRYKLPVFFLKIHKRLRGYYELELQKIDDHPDQLSEGLLTEKHTQILEEMIQEKPAYWLWTHNRWKKKRALSNSRA